MVTVEKCDNCPYPAVEFWESYGPPYADGQADLRNHQHCRTCYASLFPDITEDELDEDRDNINAPRVENREPK